MFGTDKYATVLSGNLTVTTEELVMVNKTVGAATAITLPPPIAGGMRRSVRVADIKRDAATNNITVTPVSGTVNGASGYVIAEDGAVVDFLETGSGWALQGKTALATSGAGAVVAVDGLTVLELGDAAVHKSVFIFDAVSLTTTDNGTAGHGGGTKIYDFPQGMIAIHGVSQNWSLVTVDGTGLTDVAALEIGVGTTVATSAMASLTGTAEDLIAGKTFTLSSSLSAVHQYLGSVSGSQAVDGSATAKDAFLNVTCSVATADEDGTIVLTGTVVVVWSNVGAKSS